MKAKWYLLISALLAVIYPSLIFTALETTTVTNVVLLSTRTPTLKMVRLVIDLFIYSIKFIAGFPRCHPNSGRLNHHSTAKRAAFLPQPSESPDLIIWPCPEAHSVIFLAIQTHPSCRFHLAADFSGLRWSGSWSHIIDPPQAFPKQIPGHGGYARRSRRSQHGAAWLTQH